MIGLGGGVAMGRLGVPSNLPAELSTFVGRADDLQLDRRDGVPAEQQAHAGLAEITDAGLWAEVPDALELMGGFAIDSGSFAEGARLLTAATALHECMGQRCWIADEVDQDHARAMAESFGCGQPHTIRHTYGDSADGAVVEWNMSGNYAGKPVSLDIITAYDFLGDRIVSERNYWDNAALLAQLG